MDRRRFLATSIAVATLSTLPLPSRASHGSGARHGVVLRRFPLPADLPVGRPLQLQLLEHDMGHARIAVRDGDHLVGTLQSDLIGTLLDRAEPLAARVERIERIDREGFAHVAVRLDRPLAHGERLALSPPGGHLEVTWFGDPGTRPRRLQPIPWHVWYPERGADGVARPLPAGGSVRQLRGLRPIPHRRRRLYPPGTVPTAIALRDGDRTDGYLLQPWQFDLDGLLMAGEHLVARPRGSDRWPGAGVVLIG